jgi:hypothetical protein
MTSCKLSPTADRLEEVEHSLRDFSSTIDDMWWLVRALKEEREKVVALEKECKRLRSQATSRAGRVPR